MLPIPRQDLYSKDCELYCMRVTSWNTHFHNKAEESVLYDISSKVFIKIYQAEFHSVLQRFWIYLGSCRLMNSVFISFRWLM